MPEQEDLVHAPQGRIVPGAAASGRAALRASVALPDEARVAPVVYHHPPKDAEDAIRSMRFKIWAAMLWSEVGRETVVERGGAEGWAKVCRLWSSCLSGRSIRLGEVAENLLYFGLVSKFTVAERATR